MSDDPVLVAVQRFMDAVEVRLTAHKNEIQGTLDELRTREAPKVIEGPPGKNGVDGTNGKDGKDGTDGRAGERGTDGIATHEELKAVAQEVFADFQVRTFADIYTGVYKPGENYQRGNFTTWGGSLWLALRDTKAKPGETPDWKLVVKK